MLRDTSGPTQVIPDEEGEDAPITWKTYQSSPETPDPDHDEVFAVLDDVPYASGTLTNVVGVNFREAGKIYDYDAQNVAYLRHDLVLCDFEQGVSIGRVVIPAGRRLVAAELPKILARATAADLAAERSFDDRAMEALRYARERARDRQLPIKMVRCDYVHKGAKVIVYFASEDRVDFRDLVKDLGNKLRVRVELRQIGARDEAKLVGGIGSCGRELCCSTFLPRFEPVSIKHAKEQNLPLNPSKVTGQCGRLKCCLVYEAQTYRELGKGLPKLGKRVTTPAGEGKVAELDVLRQRVRVWFEEGGSQVFPANVVARVEPPPQQGKRHRDPEPEPEGGDDDGAPPGVPPG